jgi:hypothetical protein
MPPPAPKPWMTLIVFEGKASAAKAGKTERTSAAVSRNIRKNDRANIIISFYD